jgi:hypothetical protein
MAMEEIQAVARGRVLVIRRPLSISLFSQLTVHPNKRGVVAMGHQNTDRVEQRSHLLGLAPQRMEAVSIIALVPREGRERPEDIDGVRRSY